MDWEIQEVSRDCRNCHEPFRDQDDFYTFLELNIQANPERNDFCRKCFEVLKSSWLGHAKLISQWKGISKSKITQPKIRPLPYERIEGLLRKYIAGQEERDRRFSYILILMLERKKILIHRETTVRDDAKKFLVYEHRITGDSFILEDPHLSIGQLSDVQKELKEMMDAELQLETA